MLLHVLHRTTFLYAGSVRDSFNEVRLRPVDDDRQRCLSSDLFIKPAKAEIRNYLDYYGNRVHYFDLPDSHRRLMIEVASQVETVPNAQRPPIPAVTAPQTGASPGEGMELYAEYLGESHYVPLAIELWREMQDVFAIVPRMHIWADTQHLGRHIYKTFSYKPRTTGVNTLATDALAQRAGVCQDYAHVLLGLCRLAGIPARYVSGYFFNDCRAPGTPEASHAWVEVLLPGFGWAGYDPTHDRPVDERYVKVAAGRDYADIRPVSGTYRGSPTRELRIEVAVRDVTQSPAP